MVARAGRPSRTGGFISRPRERQLRLVLVKQQAATVWAPDKALVLTDQLKKPRQESEVAATTVSALNVCDRGLIRRSMEAATLPGKLRSHGPSVADPCRELRLQDPLRLNE